MNQVRNSSGKRGSPPADKKLADLERIALLPEIAIARVGSAKQPLACYDWAGPDRTPRGSGKTKLEKRNSLTIEKDGELKKDEPEKVEFTGPTENGDGEGLRPVCPWFVIFAKWKGQNDWDVLLPQELDGTDFKLTWNVVVANRKAYNMTLKFEDIVYAEASIGGAENDGYQEDGSKLIEKMLVGKSDRNYWTKYSEFKGENIAYADEKSLVRGKTGKGSRSKKDGTELLLGRIQAPKFSPKYGIRLRFFPPTGLVYGPKNLEERIKQLELLMTDRDRQNSFDDWKQLMLLVDEELRKKCCILNPQSAWATKLVGSDQEGRTLPGPQFAHITISSRERERRDYHSLGLMDDFSDGVVSVMLQPKSSEPLRAQARIVVGPPDMAPDRRHPVTVYDTLDDREFLAEVDPRDGYERHPDKLSRDQCGEEVLDLFRRAYETVGLTNVDAMNYRLGHPTLGDPFPVDKKKAAPGGLPLTQRARKLHRRLTARETLEDTLRERAHRTDGRQFNLEPAEDAEDESVRYLINLPPGEDGEVPASNDWNRMLPLLRGSHYAPMHMTKRQIEVLRRWYGSLKKPWD